MDMAKMAKIASRLINENGNDVVLIEPVSDIVYNPATGKNEAVTVQHQEIATPINDLLTKYPQEKVELGDVLLMFQTSLEVTRQWEINYDGKTWKILDIRVVSGQNLKILKYLHLRS